MKQRRIITAVKREQEREQERRRHYEFYLDDWSAALYTPTSVCVQDPSHPLKLRGHVEMRLNELTKR